MKSHCWYRRWLAKPWSVCSSSSKGTIICQGHLLNWLFLKVAGPFPGCPYNKSPAILGSTLGSLTFGDPQM